MWPPAAWIPPRHVLPNALLPVDNLPNGLQPLADHRLITMESHLEAMGNAW
jgi:hypothetical protein